MGSEMACFALALGALAAADEPCMACDYIEEPSRESPSTRWVTLAGHAVGTCDNERHVQFAVGFVGDCLREHGPATV